MPAKATIDLSPSVSIPTLEFASQGNAVLGIRGSGKTYSATWLAEQLHEQGIPFIAFDPIGVWRFLKVPGKGRGYPVVVAHPTTGDVTLTPATAPEIVRAAMKANVSLVIDLYAMQLSKADWRRIVESCMKVLLYENGEHGLRHVFIEEAAEFCPQRVGPEQGKVYAVIESLARMGGNARLGYTLINQRAEEVNKAVLELCDCLFLHRQKGRNSLTALSKWLDLGAKAETRTIIQGISAAATGEAYIWTRGVELPLHVKMPAKNSFHPDREAHQASTGKSKAAAVDVAEFVEQLKALLPSEDEPEEEQPKAPAPAAPEPIVERVSVFADGEITKLETTKRELIDMTSRLNEIVADIGSALQRADSLSNGARIVPAAKREPFPKFIAKVGEPLKPGEKLLLQIGVGAEALLRTAAAHHPVLLSTGQLGTLAGYTPATVRKYMPRLAGLLVQTPGGWSVTDDGWRKVGTNKPRPKSKAEVQDAWLSGLAEGPRRLLQILIQTRGALTMERLISQSGYTAATVRKYLPILRRNKLIHASELRVNPDLV